MFTAMVLRAVEPYLDQSDRAQEANVYKLVSRQLQELFWQIGADIVTDNDRANIGLPLRGDNGWTAEELRVMEARKLDAMMRPISMTFPLQSPSGV